MRRLWYNIPYSMAMGITESVIEEIKARIDLADLVASYGIQVRHAGASAKACCPFHHEKTPSLKLYEDHFKCFGCGFSGDVITFVQRFNMVDFPEAMEIINREFELNLPFEDKVSLKEIRDRNRVKALRTAQIRAQKSKKLRHDALEDLWADCDRIIKEHPVPDNKQTTAAYTLRAWVENELLNFSEGETEDDSIGRMRCG